MRKVRIGFDVGVDGGIAIFINGSLEMSGKITDDLQDLIETINSWVKGGDDIHAVMEDLHSVYGSSAASNFKFGWMNGIIEAVLAVYGIPYTKVQAKKWQKEMWEGVRIISNPAKPRKKGDPQPKNKDGSIKMKTDTKGTSLLAAKRLFPREDFLATARSTVPHNGIVDAILIAEYCKRHF